MRSSSFPSRVLSSRLLFVVALFLSCATTTLVRADTPANCTYGDAFPGVWTFSLGPMVTPAPKTSLDINCSLPFTAVETYTVKLMYPDVAVDSNGVYGWFTLIYNQGFEVRIGGRVLFSFFEYETLANGTVVSYCGQTSPGWSHANDLQNWQCFTASKQSSASDDEMSVRVDEPAVRRTPAEERARLATPFRNDHTFIDAINRAQSSWQATAYPQFESMTIGEMERRAGGHQQPSLREVMEMKVREESLVADDRRHKSSKGHMQPQQQQQQTLPHLDASSIPTEWDWRNVSGLDYVSPVRDQGQCGSCYSFASMGMLEARFRVASNLTEQPILSTQDGVSCSPYSQGCNGGFPFLVAGKYAHDFGVVEEACFPYTGTDATPCTQKCTNYTRVYRSQSYDYVGGYYGAATAQLMQLEILENGPIAVSFEVYDDFMNYKSGVYRHTGLESLSSFNPFVITNHVVVIVGWGVLNGENYWLVKNSWGTNWGLDGFFMIARDTGVYGGECGIESLPVAVNVIL